MTSGYDENEKDFFDEMIEKSLAGENVAERMLLTKQIEPQELLIYCIEEHRLDELEILIQKPELKFSELLWWPLRFAISKGFEEAIEILSPRVDLDKVAHHFIGFQKNNGQINLSKSADWNLNGYDFFGLLISDELKEKWMEAYGQDICPRLCAQMMEQSIPKAIDNTPKSRI